LALTPTLYRFALDLTDVDRGVYERLDLRVARHPSETARFLIVRVLAYALHFEEGIELTPGLCADQPAVRITDPTGVVQTWIEVGRPSAARLHRATCAAERVVVYTDRRPEVLVRHLAGNRIHRRDEVELYAVGPETTDPLEAELSRQNDWALTRQDDTLLISAGEASAQVELVRIPLS